jgi:DNA topoisomerase II
MNPKDMKIAEEQGFVDYFKLRSKISTGNMICFDFDGKIKRYENPESILEDFYPKRLAYYQKRKDFLAAELQFELDRLNNQARFVQMIISRELVVSNRKKVDIVADLRKHKFKPIPKKKAKAEGETEKLVEDDEDAASEAEDVEPSSGSTSDYDYLLSMAIYTLTRERVITFIHDSLDSVLPLRPVRQTSTASWREGKRTACSPREVTQAVVEH